VAELLQYLRGAIDSFKRDPADSDYQRGYQACLTNVTQEALRLARKELDNS